ncbi:DHA1 family purine ribonucleoside efflux pump-like MFS transporter/DHA1 family bicyclomycin/chloramphenicol resistance-like MFS transporter [Rhizobium skierniewicense]|uniref:Bcr/CflA family efflux transporter n=2 Tax=Rhizobium skierniewicense TaxID=984260 RepID=A0A7W6CAX6_9HYPH|nr:DHA1 family purine ribonucleoside efflux pump-like MFS transporter/DHA1 family bicyclomycin/chloramphenicol resistance-like MFS transporter [Rhizobium skierniewicense]
MKHPTTPMSVRRTAVLGAMLTSLGPVSMAIYTPAMPELVRAFATSESAIKMSLTLYFGGFALAQLVSGAMSDAFGRRKATILFLLIYLAGGTLAAFAPSVEVLLAARLIQGIGASVGVTVARAVVRDQFSGHQAIGILNLIGIMLAVGPAAGPTIGGLSLLAFGWQSVFVLMLAFGLISITAIGFYLRETTVPDSSRLRPSRLFSAYGELLVSPRFLLSALVLGGTVGALYAQSTMLPFVLINDVGLSPTAFGVGMLMQSGAYFLGSIALRFMSRRIGDRRSAVAGLCLSATGGVLIFLSVQMLAPSFLSIMGPVAVATFGLALLTPHIITMGMAPFPHIAGSASAMMGFIQMSAGFTAGVAASVLGSPLTSFGTIIPLMELSAVASYVIFAIMSRRRT